MSSFDSIKVEKLSSFCLWVTAVSVWTVLTLHWTAWGLEPELPSPLRSLHLVSCLLFSSFFFLLKQNHEGIILDLRTGLVRERQCHATVKKKKHNTHKWSVAIVWMGPAITALIRSCQLRHSTEVTSLLSSSRWLTYFIKPATSLHLSLLPLTNNKKPTSSSYSSCSSRMLHLSSAIWFLSLGWFG